MDHSLRAVCTCVAEICGLSECRLRGLTVLGVTACKDSLCSACPCMKGRYFSYPFLGS